MAESTTLPVARDILENPEGETKYNLDRPVVNKSFSNAELNEASVRPPKRKSFEIPQIRFVNDNSVSIVYLHGRYWRPTN